MNIVRADVLVLGSGFGGSLLALILARAGRSVVMVDRSQHPRFAIGESSTPLADRTMAQMADRYGLPELRPLCHWGSWKRELPNLTCGKKRGFTYFDQTHNESPQVARFSDRRLLVAASVDDEHSDTHWLRSDVDQFLCQLAESSGARVFQNCLYTLKQNGSEWEIEGHADDAHVLLSAPFLVDATGSGSGVLRSLNVPDQTHLLRTNSRSLFAHFADTDTCEQLLTECGVDQTNWPYHCDDAAVHQVLSDGWMWQLRFDENTLSAGFMVDERPNAHPVTHTFSSPMDEWNWRIARTPFLSRQFRNAKIVRPESGLQKTARIQRLAGQGAGVNWAALTNTIGFVDPLHSTGIAHTLFSVSRVADILLTSCDGPAREQRLRNYSATMIGEIRCVDEFVEGCYAAIPSFRLWCLWGMLYFNAATSMEQQSDTTTADVSFLRASDEAFREVLKQARHRLELACRCAPSGKTAAETDFAAWLQVAITPWNRVGLFDEICDNLYSTTAAPADAW